MSSLKDQLLGLGFKPTPKPEQRPRPGGPARAKPREAGKRDAGKREAGKAKSRKPAGEMDLAKAYAIRAQKEKEERIRAEQEKQEAARLRREARARLAEFIDGKALNAAEADIARHFEYGGKIKRIHVTAEQLKALNAGELGVVQHNGRYLLVDAATLAQAEAIFADAIALKVDPHAPAEDDPYTDPKYQVPDDLVW